MDVKEQTQRTLGLVNALAMWAIELPRATELEAGQALEAIARVKRWRGYRDL
jgi:hypothetical protein